MGVRSRLAVVGLLACLSLSGGCMIVPVITGGDMVVQPSPQSKVSPPRYILLTYYDAYSEQFQDAWVITAPGQRVHYPARFHLGVFALIAHGGPDLFFTTEESFGLVAFAPDCWPTSGHQYNFGAGVTRLYRRPLLRDDNQAAIPPGANALAQVGFLPSSMPWNQAVAGNAGAWDGKERYGQLGSVLGFIESLIATVDRAGNLSDADRTLVYRQLLDVTLLYGAMEDARVSMEEYDNAQRLLRERLEVLCLEFGEPAPPPLSGEPFWLARIKADVSTHGIGPAAWQWLGPACDAGWAECVRHLLAVGADPNVCWDAKHPRPLGLAARRGHLNVAKVLLDAKVDVNALIGKDKDGLLTALVIAVLHKRHEMAEYLLVSGANSNLHSPLFWAAKAGDDKTVELLLRHQADISVSTSDGNTPLHAAIPCFNCCDKHRALALEPHWDRTVSRLLEAGANPNAADAYGRTPLHLAAEGGSAEVVTLLLKAGADPDIKDKDGRTPLALARDYGNPAAEKALETWGR